MLDYRGMTQQGEGFVYWQNANMVREPQAISWPGFKGFSWEGRLICKIFARILSRIFKDFVKDLQGFSKILSRLSKDFFKDFVKYFQRFFQGFSKILSKISKDFFKDFQRFFQWFSKIFSRIFKRRLGHLIWNFPWVFLVECGTDYYYQASENIWLKRDFSAKKPNSVNIPWRNEFVPSCHPSIPLHPTFVSILWTLCLYPSNISRIESILDICHVAEIQKKKFEIYLPKGNTPHFICLCGRCLINTYQNIA